MRNIDSVKILAFPKFLSTKIARFTLSMRNILPKEDILFKDKK